MAVDAGQKAPGFDLPTDGGGRVRLEDFRGKPVVLYFYPKDDTSGCTKEAQGFAGAYGEFRAAGAEVIGVSKDGVASHDKFKAKYGLPFPLGVGRGRQGRRGLRRLGREKHVWAQLHGHRPLDLPDRRRRQGPQGLAPGEGAGPRRGGAGGDQGAGGAKGSLIGGRRMARAYVIGTCDTKGPELAYLQGAAGGGGRAERAGRCRHQERRCGRRRLAARGRGLPSGRCGRRVLGRPRRRDRAPWRRRSPPSWPARDDVGGVIGAGGSGGTALISPALRALPVGVPKVLVSTVASGNVGPYVGPADICMMYSVTDVQGLNSISRRVLGNAAHALAGMMRHAIPPASEPAQAGARPHHVRRHHALRADGRQGAGGATTTASCSTPPAPAASRWRSSSIPG